MGTIKSIIAFILGAMALIFCYNNIHIPIVVSFCYYVAGMLFTNKHNAPKLRILFIVLLALFGIYLYGYGGIYYSIKFYPQYRNILGIIFDFINVISIISASFMNIIHNLGDIE